MKLNKNDMDLKVIENVLAYNTNLKITYFVKNDGDEKQKYSKDNSVVAPLTRKQFIEEYSAALDEGKNMTFDIVSEEPTKFIFGKLYIRKDGKMVYSFQIKEN